MIDGHVNAALEAEIRLVIQGPTGQTRGIETVVDTGYTGFLTLPPGLVAELELGYATRGKAFLADGTVAHFDIYRAVVTWEGHSTPIEVDATGDRPLVGMELLRGHRLNVEVVEGGRVSVQVLDRG